MFVLMAGVIGVQAQDTAGVLSGIVADPSGAAVMGVKVVAENEGTKAQMSASTGADGSYRLRVNPGLYKVLIEAPGFQQFQATSIRVQLNETTRVDASLALGSTTQVMDVRVSPVTVDTTTVSSKTTIQESQIQELPLNGRNATQLMQLVAGVTRDPSANVTSGATFPGTTPVSVNGTRSNSVNYVLDGTNNNAHYNNSPNPLPNPDALQEFSVQTSMFSAEYGRQAGGVVNAVTKSGTNEIHGSAYEYLRNNAMNATNFFGSVVNGERQDDGLKRNQFGVSLGGPVVLPHLYSGKDRTFFFFSYQGTRLRQRPSTSNQVVPTAAMRNGDFSSLSTVIKDSSGVPYANNQIPSALFNPVSAKLLNYIPTPTSGSLVYYTTVNNNDENDYVARVDHQLTQQNRLSVFLREYRVQQPGYLSSDNYLAAVAPTNWVSRSLQASDTHVFGPTLINEFAVSYVHNPYLYKPVQPEQSLSGLGMNIHDSSSYKSYEYYVGGYYQVLTGDLNDFLNDEYQFVDTMRWSSGRHDLSFGGEYGYGVGDQTNTRLQNGLINFSSSASSGAPFSGNGFADYLTGHFSSYQQGAGQAKNTRFNKVSLFVHDNIKMSRKLTVNLGVRWEPFLPYTDTNDRMTVWGPGQQSTRFVNAPTGVLYPGDTGIGSGGYSPTWTNFAPRVGLAYDVRGDGKWAIRTGYGIFYDQPNTIFTNNAATQGPFSPNVTITGNSANSLSDPWAGTTDPFPVAANPSSTVSFPNYSSQYLYAKNLRNGYIQSWNFSVDHEIGNGTVVSVAYSGSKGTYLPAAAEMNMPVYASGATVGNENARRPYAPAMGSSSLLSSSSNSNFNALQISARRRFANGFSLLVNYQFSKAIDNSSNSKQTGQSVTDPNNRNFDRGVADFDRRHVFNAAGVWQLPGKWSSKTMQAFLGGWSLNLIGNYTGGYPFSIYSGVDNALTGTGSQRADLVSGASPYFSSDRSKGDQIYQYFNKAAFTSNAVGTFGSTGRNSFRGPAFVNFDSGLYKSFKVQERLTTTLRFEAFNMLNHTNLKNPNNSVSSSQFMRITSAYDPRIMQVALRVAW